MVTTPVGGTSAATAADQFTYVAVPTVSSVSPNSGPLAGGTSVTITGTGFTNASTVAFGASSASQVTFNSANKLTAISPAGSAGTVDVTVTTPVGGTSATGSAGDKFTYTSGPTVTSVSPSSGPAAGGTTVTITGTGFTNGSTVKFGATSAGSVTFNSATQLTATSPAGSGVVDITVTTPSGTSLTSAADQFSYQAPPTGTPPVVVTGHPMVTGPTHTGSFEGTVNPENLTTTAHFELGLDAKYRGPGATGIVYDQSTPDQVIGSDATVHPVSGMASGLVPHALYHVRLVASNSAGTTDGPDATFMTPEDPAPPAPVIGKTVLVTPGTGIVFVKGPPGRTLAGDPVAGPAFTKGRGFIPLTEARDLPSGSQVDARAGTLNLAAASSVRHGKLQTGTFGGAIFSVVQGAAGLTKGQTTLTLLDGDFPGAPTFSACPKAAADTGSVFGPIATVASSKILQALRARDNHGNFRTRGRFASGTVRGTVWTTVDRCDGTLTTVQRGTVLVTDFRLRKTITLHAGQSYLALAAAKRK
jgi:hypothetical protein